MFLLLYAIVSTFYKCSSYAILQSFKGLIKDLVTRPKYSIQYQSSGAYISALL